MNKITTVKLVEIEAPEMLQEAITEEFFTLIRMQPIPVHITRNRPEMGACNLVDQSDMGEIEMSEFLFFYVESKSRRDRRLKTIKSVYLHECAHRLTNQRHFGGFLALNILLHMRASLLNEISIYDWQEEKHFKKVFEFAYGTAEELAETELTAERCAEIILQKYNAWAEWMDGADARAAELESRKQVAAASRQLESQAIKNQIKGLKKDRWLFAFAFSIITFVLTLFFK